MKRSEQLALGAILLSTGVIFVPTKAEPLLVSEPGYQAAQKQRSAWQPAVPKTRLREEQSCENFFLHSAPTARTPGLLWHHFSLVSPPVIEYWLMAARHFKCCWKRVNTGT